MKKNLFITLLINAMILFSVDLHAESSVPASLIPTEDNKVVLYFDKTQEKQEKVMTYSDPLESFNRVSFIFNDKMIRWVIDPVGTVYEYIIPVFVRSGIRNFGTNLASPVRILGNLFQGKLTDSGTESLRFLINSSIGILGLFDVATEFGIEQKNEDFGQTFGAWGAGNGIYLVIPIIGPCSARDCLGKIFDSIVDLNSYTNAGWFIRFNELTFTLDEYLATTNTSSDPYDLIKQLLYLQRTIETQDINISKDQKLYTPSPTINAAFHGPKDPKFHEKNIYSSMFSDVGSIKIGMTEKDLDYNLYLQDKKAPIVYIIPGLGSHRSDSTTVMLAEFLFNQGNHVISISSTFTKEFNEKVMPHQLPGNPYIDSVNVIGVLTMINRQVRSEYDYKITDNHIVGFSLGALHSLYIADYEHNNGYKFFKSYVAINPPIDLIYSMKVLDNYYEIPNLVSKNKVEAMNFAFNSLKKASFLIQSKDLDISKGIPLSPNEANFLIGKRYRDTLSRLLATRLDSNFVFNNNIEMSRKNIYSYAKKLSFTDYYKKLLRPNISINHYNEKSIINNITSLNNIKKTLKNKKNIVVIDNEDDFLNNNKERKNLKSILKDKMVTFQRGGHLGNMNTLAVREKIINVLNR